MKAMVGWLAVAAVLYCAYFIASRVLKLLFGRKRSGAVLHDELADVAEDVAGASKVVAALSAAAAWFLAPAGLLALGAAIGLVPTPLIAKLVPALAVFAVGATAFAALAKLYAKSRRKKK